MPENKISDAIGCDGALHLHLTDKKSQLRYFCGFANFSFTGDNSKWGYAENKTTRANTDTRLGPNVFLRGNVDRQIAIDEAWGGFS